ncbi:enoyl-CoA hydratase-related protein [Pseudorhodoferax sp. Leaf267]|uniref:enoyl-CoA hydratase-related protein n=1 Tax=Pseudorhodoferax sp. Leaf267 TaxID=1736316 RepID=UPI0006F359A2|nr:enoyl-CoA hydratase-related protein [Pseudorhodoferax sp. Leaf267]KQP13079.1 enoyl-CoA hydratase [Pseudorhodoferax sp. Leaf267]
MHFTELGYSVADRVAVLRFERPERMNAWTPTLETELRQALAQAERDDAVRCIVLTGAGRAFCAGMDMEVLRGAGERPGGPLAEGERYAYLDLIDKPLVAAINGAAAGVGLCLALYCDLRFVAAGAKLTAPYARRGLAAEHGIAWLLPRLVGPMHAADLLLSGRTLLADEADRMGLARQLPAEGFLDAVLERARELANATSPRSVRVMKRQLREARTQTLGEATRLADREIAACRGTDDFREGVQHFLDKRAPHFTGT